MNIILGGGLTAMLARDILEGDWTLIPIGRSRFYSFNPPLADNFIVRDDLIMDYVDKWAVLPIIHKFCYSYGGQLIFSTNLALQPYLDKLYKGTIPPQAEPYWRNRIEVVGYGDCMHIYHSLHDKYKDEIFHNNDKYSKPTRIVGRTIFTDTGAILEYDRIVSTVPLYATLSWLGVEGVSLPSVDQHFYHVRTDDLDFEGATIVMVADAEIDFHRVYRINKTNYIIQSSEPIKQPGKYFMQFMRDFDLIAETRVEKAICRGPSPKIPKLDDAGIICVGAYAAWDDCLDIGSCIMQLIRLNERA